MLEGKRSKFELFPNRRWPTIPPLRFYVGIYVGLCYSYLLYAFMNLTREVHRYLSITIENDIWIQSDHDLYWTNFSLAILSLLWSQSICMLIWFHRPQSIVGFKRFNVNTLVNDLRVLIIFFFYWFFQIALVLLIFFIPFGFHYYTDFKVLVFVISGLVSIVLFLQNWNFIRLKFGKYSLKYQMAFLFGILSLAFLYAPRNFYNYKNINARILSKNIYYKYKLDLPETKNTLSFRKPAYGTEIFLSYSKSNNSTPKSTYVFKNIEIDPNALLDTLRKTYEKYNRGPWENQYQRVSIDKNTTMERVFHLFKTLDILRKYSVPIHVTLDPAIVNPRSSIYEYMPHRNPVYPDSVLLNIYNTYYKSKSHIELELNKNDNFLNKNKEVNLNQIDLIFQRGLEEKDSESALLIVHPMATFDAYVKFLEQIRITIDYRHDLVAHKEFLLPYDKLSNSEKKHIREQSRMILLVLSQDQAFRLKNEIL